MEMQKNEQISPFPFNCRKVRRAQLSSIFFLLVSLISQTGARSEQFFLKKYIKSGNITEKKYKILKDF